MKLLKILLPLTGIVGMAILWTGCKKDAADVPQEQLPQVTSSARVGGAVADDPIKVSKVPMIMSSDFVSKGTMNTSPEISSVLRGRKPPALDVTAPTVSITSPANGATVSGVVNITVSASDNVKVASVSVSVDGNVIGTLTSSPYNFTWDATNAIDGTHNISATAKDAAGNTGSTGITVAKNTVIIIVPPPPGGGSIPTSFMQVTPPVGNQGGEWSCVVFATTYVARSIEQYYRTNASSYSQSTNIFSPEYVYNQVKFSADCGSGTSIGAALELMKQQGASTWSTMPYSDQNGCSLMPNSTQTTNAASYKIGGYTKLASSDQTAIKTMVSSKHPVVVSLNVDNGFINAASDFTWNSYSGSGGLMHTAVIVGYDDSKRAYRIMNSWGPSWAGGGFCWVDYDFFLTRTGYYSYVMNY